MTGNSKGRVPPAQSECDHPLGALFREAIRQLADAPSTYHRAFLVRAFVSSASRQLEVSACSSQRSHLVWSWPTQVVIDGQGGSSVVDGQLPTCHRCAPTCLCGVLRRDRVAAPVADTAAGRSGRAQLVRAQPLDAPVRPRPCVSRDPRWSGSCTPVSMPVYWPAHAGKGPRQ